jgi:general stress protein YciG
MDDQQPKEPEPTPRGFAALTPEQRRALGSKGGRIAQQRGTAHRFDSVSASAAGKIPHERGTACRWNSEQAREAGRKGKGIPRPRKRKTDAS